MPGFTTEHTFDSVSEFRDAIDQLAQASSHPVYVDLDRGYGSGGSAPDNPKQIDHQAIWNTRDDDLAYIGTDSYEITQHHEVLDTIDRAIGQTVGEIDIGRVRDYGERIDGMLTLNGHNVDVGALVGDGYVPPEGELLDDRTQSVPDAFGSDGTVRDILGVGIRFGNSFDASERIRVETMGYRYVCQNWMIWGKETIGEYTQLHVDELATTHIEDLIFDVIDKQEEIEGIVADSVQDRLKWSWIAPLLEDAGFGIGYQKRIVKKLQSYAGCNGDEVRRWDVYNAITDLLDNEVMVSGDDGVNANVYDRHQGRAQAVLTEDISSSDEPVPVDELLGNEENLADQV